jgi:hypothetical protein
MLYFKPKDASIGALKSAIEVLVPLEYIKNKA